MTNERFLPLVDGPDGMSGPLSTLPAEANAYVGDVTATDGGGNAR